MARYRLRPGPRQSNLNYDEGSPDDDDDDESFDAARRDRLATKKPVAKRRPGLRAKRLNDAKANNIIDIDDPPFLLTLNSNTINNNNNNVKALLTREVPASNLTCDLDKIDDDINGDVGGGGVDDDGVGSGENVMVPNAVINLPVDANRLFPPSDHDRHSTATIANDILRAEEASSKFNDLVDDGISPTRSEKWKKSRRIGGTIDAEASRRTSKRLVHKRMKFPFSSLPLECQSHIFSLLPAKERLNAASVCRSWRALTSAPSIWTNVDLTQFKIKEEILTNHCKCFRKCKHLEAFECYRSEICKYVDHLVNRVCPLMKELKFNLDFGHPVDAWDSLVMRLLTESQHLNALTSVAVKWDETPNRPACLTRYCCLVGQMRTAIHRHIQRIHIFRAFLDLLSKKARCLQYFRLPFDWSTTHVLYLTRFTKLRHLTLDHYQTFQQLPPWKINYLLQNLHQLHSLKISYVSPSFKHTQLYSFQSSSLRHLDISSCVGLFLHRLETPALEEIVLARLPWQGSLKDVEEERAKIPCLREVLRGAPKLRSINSYHLAYSTESSTSTSAGLGGDYDVQHKSRRLDSASALRKRNRDDKNADAATALSVATAASLRLRSDKSPFDLQPVIAASADSSLSLVSTRQPPPRPRKSSSSWADRRRGRAGFENLLFKICPCANHGRAWKRISTVN